MTRHRKLTGHSARDSADHTCGTQRTTAANGRSEALAQYPQEAVAASTAAPESTPSRSSDYQVVLTRR